MSYDIVGDVHGQVEKLKALLNTLGYRIKDGAYRHPEGRMALFLGDLIDRGPEQVEVIDIVRNMIEAGSSRSIMGNHEWNAIGCGMRDPEGSDYLRPRIEAKMKEHKEFLRQVGMDSPLHMELVGWFKTLPPVLDLGSIRLCHAWWKPDSIETIKPAMDGDGKLDETFLISSFRKRSIPWAAIDFVTKGYEISLPGGDTFLDHNEVPRKEIRVRWWDKSATNYRQAALVPERERGCITDLSLPEEVTLGATSTIPTFVGHYWLTGTPGVQNATTAVLDYGAGNNGPLVAYRWDGEDVLINENMVWVSQD
jgi:hypothetical protein